MKSTLANAGNVIIPAYLALLERGFTVLQDPVMKTGSAACWVAEDSGHRFVAEDLVTLLGLVALYEIRGREWRASDEQIDRFLAEFGVP